MKGDQTEMNFDIYVSPEISMIDLGEVDIITSSDLGTTDSTGNGSDSNIVDW